MHIHTHKHDKIHETPQRRIKNNKTYTHKPKKQPKKITSTIIKNFFLNHELNKNVTFKKKLQKKEIQDDKTQI